MIPESPGEPTLTLTRPPDPDEALPMTDLYLISPSRPGVILAIDHEDEGTWVLDETIPKVGIDPYFVPPISSDSPNGREVAPELAGRVRAKVKRRLREKGCDVPRYPLARSGAAKDYWWNYLPETLDVSIREGRFIDRLVRESEVLLVWTDHSASAWLVRGADVRLRELGDAYYLDWPECRLAGRGSG